MGSRPRCLYTEARGASDRAFDSGATNQASGEASALQDGIAEG